MNILLLCAGYGTRLLKDIEANTDYAHLSDVPKPLLPVAGKQLISHWTNMASENTEICIIVNQLHKKKYEAWADGQARSVNIVCDGSMSNEKRLGAVACIWKAVHDAIGTRKPVLVIAGDTLLKEDFNLTIFVQTFEKLNRQGETPISLILDCPCPESEVQKRGIIEIDEKTKRVTSFLEKPDPASTSSRRQCPCFYMLHPEHLNLLRQFLDERKNAPLVERDATGHFLRYLVEHGVVHSFSVSGRYDVGGLESYVKCCEEIAWEKKDLANQIS